MPKRTNDFQKLVYLVRVNLAAGATVTESKMLTDRLTGRKREVDVCIEGAVGGQQVKVCIECRDHKRPADVSWVEALKSKHERLPTNALILASKSGFTPAARALADKLGVEALSFDDFEKTDFSTLLGSSSSLWAKTVTCSAKKVLVKVLATTTRPEENVAVMPDNLVYASDGAEICQIGLIITAMIKSPYARDYLLTKGDKEHVWFEFCWEPVRDHNGNPLFLKKIEPEMLRQIESIQIKGPCEFKIGEFGIRRGRLGAVQVAWGKPEILAPGTMLVATKDEQGAEKVSLSFAGKAPAIDKK
jgi:hypothetical protein